MAAESGGWEHKQERRDEEHSRKRLLLPLVIAILGLAAIGVAQGVPIRHRIEDDLTARSDAALREAGLSTVDVEFVGRDGTLRAGSRADADRALAIVRAQEGVRVARAEVTAAPVTGTPTIVISLDGGRAVLTGTVATASAKRSVAEGIRGVLGADAVDDRLVVTAGLSDTGTTGLDGVVTALGKDARGTVIELRGGTLTLTGTVATQTVKDTALAAAARVVGTPASVVDKLIVPTGAEPAVPSAQQIQAELAALPPITFQSGRATLTAEGQANVERAAALLRVNPAIRVRVEGHTDTHGPADRNQTLSEARAGTVLTALAMLGVAPDRLTAAGLGETRPRVPDTSAANQAANRRVEFVVLT